MYIDGTHAWLYIERLRSAGSGLGPGWAEGFDGMVGYARQQGWQSDDGRSVRAHVDNG